MVQKRLRMMQIVPLQKNYSLDYMVVAIPVGKLGVGFGLMPYSSVGYKNTID